MGRLCVVSRDKSSFEDREDAGRGLGKALEALRRHEPLVLGVPRGGLVVAHVLAKALDADLDAVFALKLRFPGNPEFAVGAVAEGGRVFLDETFVEKLDIAELMEEEKRRALSELARRSELIRKFHPRLPLKGRTVVVADDGAATGATTRAAFRAVAEEHPRKIIGAIPVGDEAVVKMLAKEVDEMVCLRCPPEFRAVSQFYRSFPQVTDKEIIQLFSPPSPHRAPS